MDKFFGLFSGKKKKRYENCLITNPVNIEYHPENNSNESLQEINSSNVSTTILMKSNPIEENKLDQLSVPLNVPKQVPQSQQINEVVVVNTYDRVKKPESQYSQKYSQKISNLKLVNINKI